MKIFNAEREARMISQKLAMVGVQMFDNYKVTWDTHMANVRPINSRIKEEKQVVNQITVDKLREEYPKVFVQKIECGANQFLQPAKVCHKEINWKVEPSEIPMTNIEVNNNLGQVPQ